MKTTDNEANRASGHEMPNKAIKVKGYNRKVNPVAEAQKQISSQRTAGVMDEE